MWFALRNPQDNALPPPRLNFPKSFPLHSKCLLVGRLPETVGDQGVIR